jgi:hypothetical protein
MLCIQLKNSINSTVQEFLRQFLELIFCHGYKPEGFCRIHRKTITVNYFKHLLEENFTFSTKVISCYFIFNFQETAALKKLCVLPDGQT